MGWQSAGVLRRYTESVVHCQCLCCVSSMVILGDTKHTAGCIGGCVPDVLALWSDYDRGQLAVAVAVYTYRLKPDDLRAMASAAMSAADVARRTTLRRLKETFGHKKLQVGIKLYQEQIHTSTHHTMLVM